MLYLIHWKKKSDKKSGTTQKSDMSDFLFKNHNTVLGTLYDVDFSTFLSYDFLFLVLCYISNNPKIILNGQEKHIVQNVGHNEYSRTVWYDRKNDNFTCTCDTLLFRGIFYRHILTVSTKNVGLNIGGLPINKRWQLLDSLKNSSLNS